MVVGAHDQHAGQLAVGASGRLQGHPREAADLFEHFLQRVHQQQVALHRLERLERVGEGEARQAGGIFIHARVVLHGARAERIEAAVDAVVQLREVGKVADDAHFRYFGEVEVITQQVRGQRIGAWNVRLREAHTGAPG